MSALSNYLENKLVDHIFRGQTFAAPVTIYVALCTTATDDAGGGTEVTGGSYARVPVTCSLANWSGTQGAGTTVASSGTGGQISNNVAITFAAPTAAWGTVTNFKLMDALSGGNMLAHGTLGTPRTVNSGDSAPYFAAGSLTATLA